MKRTLVIPSGNSDPRTGKRARSAEPRSPRDSARSEPSSHRSSSEVRVNARPQLDPQFTQDAGPLSLDPRFEGPLHEPYSTAEAVPIGAASGSSSRSPYEVTHWNTPVPGPSQSPGTPSLYDNAPYTGDSTLSADLEHPRSSRRVPVSRIIEPDALPASRVPPNSVFPPGAGQQSGTGPQVTNTHSLLQGAHDLTIGGSVNTTFVQGNQININHAPREATLRSLANDLKPSRKADHKTDLTGEGDSGGLRRQICTPGTRTGIIQDIYGWAGDTLPDSQDVFWLFGPAGSGKTTIAYTIAQHLDADNTITTLGGNFFCSRQFEETRTKACIVRTIVYKLASRCKGFADALSQMGTFDTIYQSVEDQLHGLLVVPWLNYRSAPSTDPSSRYQFLILIDAVDELVGRGGPEFLQDLLTVINENHLPGLKFFVTSRSDPAIVSRLKSFGRKRLLRLQDVEEEEVKRDISMYLVANLPHFEGTREMQRIARSVGNLFICAATIVRLLDPKVIQIDDQKEILRELFASGNEDSMIDDTTDLINNLYTQILSQAFHPFEKLKSIFLAKLNILHTLLCTTERTSTSVVAQLLDPLAGPGLTPLPSSKGADGIVSRLYAVLYIDSKGNVLSYHKSFTDFIVDPKRLAGRFACDQSACHRFLTQQCFRIMEKGLKFNIANIPSSFVLDSENPGLQGEVERSISPGLSYACRSWCQHLTLTPCMASDPFLSTLSDFLQLQVLFWIEAMNLLQRQRQCDPNLQRASRWVGIKDPALTQQLMETATFAAYFGGSPASTSTPHLYISALATWPPGHGPALTWRRSFPRIPDFKSFGARRSISELSQLQTKVNTPMLALSTDGSQVVCAFKDGSVRVYDASTGKELNLLQPEVCNYPSNSRQLSVAISGDLKRIVTVTSQGGARIWDISTGQQLSTLENLIGRVPLVCISADGTRIICESTDSIMIWDALAGKQLKTLDAGGAPVALSAAMSRVACASRAELGSSIRIWDLSTGELLAMLKGVTASLVAISPDGKYVVSWGLGSTVIRIWEVLTGKQTTLLEGHEGRVSSIAIFPDGTRIASGSWDNTVRIWDMSTGQQLSILEGHTGGVTIVTVFPDGMRIISGSDQDGSIRIWDARVSLEHASSSTDVTSIVPGGHTNAVSSIAISADTSHIVSGSIDNSVRIWDGSTGKALRVFEGHSGAVNSVAVSVDGKHIVSGSDDTSIRIWEVLAGQQMAILEGHAGGVVSVAIFPSGMRIASGSQDKTVRIWDVSTGQQLGILEGHTSGVRAVAIFADGLCVASGSSDASIRVWDVLTGNQLKVLKGHTEVVYSVAVSADGGHIVSSSEDLTIRVWDTLTGSQLGVLGGMVQVFDLAIISPGAMHIISRHRTSARIWALSPDKTCLNKLSPPKVMDFSRIPGVNPYTFSAISISGDATHIVTGTGRGLLQLWSTATTSKVLQHIDTLNGRERPTYTGWVHSNDSKRIIFIPPSLGLPALPLVRIFPTTDESRLPSLNFEQGALGTEWHKCYLLQP